jgi:membrane protein DedA with SNARE-associated domain
VMQPARFLAADFAGAGLWAAVFTGLGYVFADRLDDLRDALHGAQIGLGLALVAALAAAIIVRWRRA